MQNDSISKFDFEKCQKCSICVSVCPMKEANPLYPGPKLSGPDGERYRLKDPQFFDQTLKYCLNCKRCEVACPSGVKVADLIASAKLKYGKISRPLRDWTLANTDFVGTMAVPFAPIINPLLGSNAASVALDTFMGVDRHRTFPSYTKEKFVTWFNGPDAPSQEGFDRYVSYFHGCYVNYNHPSLGKDFVKVMNACGYGVRLMDKEKCCGLPLIANGFGGKAKRHARLNTESMSKALETGSEAVLTTSSSCTFTMRDEYQNLLGVDNSGVKDSLQIATKFIYEALEDGKVKLVFKDGYKARYAYHTPCHMQRMGWQVYTIALLKMIPGLELVVLPQECCGIAGTFGFKKENYEYSTKIGNKLFDEIRSAEVPGVVTDCETCKMQIEMGTGLPVKNPIEILAEAIDFDKTNSNV